MYVVIVKKLPLQQQSQLEGITVDIRPQADVRFIVSEICNAQFETRAALNDKGQTDVIPCLFQAFYG